MLGNLTLILLCQLLGEIITHVTKMPVPGPVIGMVFLFCYLAARRGIPEEMDKVGGFLHRYLPLLFVPAGVGVVTNLDLLMKSWLPLAAVIVVGTLLTIGVTGLVMQFMNRRERAHGGQEP